MKRFIKAFGFAWNGLRQAFRTEPNFRFELLCAFLVVFLGFYFQLSKYEWVACVFCIGIVLLTELMNTAIESLTNLVSPGYHELAKNAKDLAAAAVLLAAFCALVVGLIIFVPHCIVWFHELA